MKQKWPLPKPNLTYGQLEGKKVARNEQKEDHTFRMILKSFGKENYPFLTKENTSRKWKIDPLARVKRDPHYRF